MWQPKTNAWHTWFLCIFKNQWTFFRQHSDRKQWWYVVEIILLVLIWLQFAQRCTCLFSRCFCQRRLRSYIGTKWSRHCCHGVIKRAELCGSLCAYHSDFTKAFNRKLCVIAIWWQHIPFGMSQSSCASHVEISLSSIHSWLFLTAGFLSIVVVCAA